MIPHFIIPFFLTLYFYGSSLTLAQTLTLSVDFYSDDHCNTGFVNTTAVPLDTCFQISNISSLTVDICRNGQQASVQAFQDTSCSASDPGLAFEFTFPDKKGDEESCWGTTDITSLTAIRVGCDDSKAVSASISSVLGRAGQATAVRLQAFPVQPPH